jgi:hypothetical protein
MLTQLGRCSICAILEQQPWNLLTDRFRGRRLYVAQADRRDGQSPHDVFHRASHGADAELDLIVGGAAETQASR